MALGGRPRPGGPRGAPRSQSPPAAGSRALRARGAGRGAVGGRGCAGPSGGAESPSEAPFRGRARPLLPPRRSRGWGAAGAAGLPGCPAGAGGGTGSSQRPPCGSAPAPAPAGKAPPPHCAHLGQREKRPGLFYSLEISGPAARVASAPCGVWTPRAAGREEKRSGVRPGGENRHRHSGLGSSPARSALSAGFPYRAHLPALAVTPASFSPRR